MANSSSFQLQGFEELGQVLDALGDKLGPKVVDGILRTAAKPYLRRAKELSSNADVTGDTTKSIGIIANRKAGSITVGPRRGGGFKGYHAHLLEYGVQAHVIRAKAAGGLLHFAGTFAHEVHHPGFAAQPFLRPAFDETSGAVVASIKDQTREIIASQFKNIKF